MFMLNGVENDTIVGAATGTPFRSHKYVTYPEDMQPGSIGEVKTSGWKSAGEVGGVVYYTNWYVVLDVAGLIFPPAPWQYDGCNLLVLSFCFVVLSSPVNLILSLLDLIYEDCVLIIRP